MFGEARYRTGACGLLLGALLCLAAAPAAAQPPGTTPADTVGVATPSTAAPPPIATPLTAPPAATGTVRGRVIDGQSREAIGGAEVAVVRSRLHAYTDDDGRFILEHVPAGACTLSVARMGYVLLRRELMIVAGVETRLELRLTRNAVPLEQVTVTPGSFSFMGQGAGTRQTMSREDVEAVPQIGDDIFRAVNRLPGLASNDYAAHFGIRGGRHDETLILLDGLELYEPYHLKDFNEGAVSIIDAETIDGVQLMTGGFPARYGNKRSGVFDVTSRTPEPDIPRPGREFHEHARHGTRLVRRQPGLVARVRPGRIHGSGVPVHRPGGFAPAVLRGCIREGELPADTEARARARVSACA